MKKQNSTAFLYELALSMGSSADLRPMLQTCLQLMGQHLKPCSIFVLQREINREEIKAEGLGEMAFCRLDLDWQLLQWFPDDLQQVPEPCQLQADLHLPVYEMDLNAWRLSLPQTRVKDSVWQYIFDLPGFGALVLYKEAQPLDADFVFELQRLMKQLAHFCRSCVTESYLLQQIEASQAASKAKSRFLANMSHEIRTPMNGVIGMLDLVLSTPLAREQKENLDLARFSAEHLLEIINHLLDLSKIEAGKLELQPRTFDLHELLGQTLRSLSGRAKVKNILLHYDMDPELPNYVYADPSRLRQMLINLLGNAIKFTSVGEVHLDARYQGRQGDEIKLELRVKDTGIGMSKAALEKIFEPFEQINSESTRQFEGTGLGLSIVKKLAEMMGGEIHAESKPDSGSVFTLHLCFPLAEKPAAALLQDAGFNHLRVLVVDDHPVNRRVLAAMLSRFDIKPGFATSGPEALFQLRLAADKGQAYDLVFLDAQMPGIGGFAVAEQIQKDAQLQKTRQIILTVSAEAGDAQKCRDLGLAGYLTKPLITSELKASLCQVLGELNNSTPDHPAAAPARSKQGFSILLAEDNPVNRKLAVKLLERKQHQVALAHNGQQALDLLQKRAFDLVLMDMMMPVMDGLEATRRWRQQEQEEQRPLTPIVAMTANAMEGDKERCLAEGMQGYVPKPVDPQLLYSEIDRVVAKYKVSRVRLPEDMPGEFDDLLDQADSLLTRALETPSVQPIQAAQAVKKPLDFDWQQALQRLDADEDLLCMALKLFIDEYPAYQTQLKEAWQARDWDELGGLAHSLKSLLATFAAEKARKEAERLEQLAKQGAEESALEAVLERLQAGLDALLPQLLSQLGSDE